MSLQAHEKRGTNKAKVSTKRYGRSLCRVISRNRSGLRTVCGFCQFHGNKAWHKGALWPRKTTNLDVLLKARRFYTPSDSIPAWKLPTSGATAMTTCLKFGTFLDPRNFAQRTKQHMACPRPKGSCWNPGSIWHMCISAA